MADSKPEHSLNFAAAEEVLESQPEEFKVPVHVDDWDEYFLWLAKTASIKSKDPKCPVGAAIASKDHILLSTGFNGMARGVYDDDRTLDDAEEKIKVICHAEDNAILNAARIGARLEGATIYVTKFPCLQCCNAIVQAGIRARLARVTGMKYVRRQAMVGSFEKGAIPPEVSADSRGVRG